MRKWSLVIAIALSVRLIGDGPAAQWLIESADGKWEVQSGKASARPMAKFDLLTSQDRVRCVQLPCTLTYFSEDHGTDRLEFNPPARTRLGKWFPMPSPPRREPAPELRQTLTRLDAMLENYGNRGGATKAAPTCGGDLPLVAPECDETIDRLDLTLAWPALPSDAGKSLTLLVTAGEPAQRRRWNGIRVDAGEFHSDELSEFLGRVQRPDRATDITLTLLRTETNKAVRMVRLPSAADESIHRQKMQSLSALPDLPRHLSEIDEFLRRSMWSSAARRSQQLLRDVPDNIAIRKYALAGLCLSGYVEEKGALRTALSAAGFPGLCRSM